MTHPNVSVGRYVDLHGDVVVLLVVVLGQGLLGREANDILLVPGRSRRGGRDVFRFRAGRVGEFGGVTDAQLAGSLCGSVEDFLHFGEDNKQTKKHQLMKFRERKGYSIGFRHNSQSIH